MSKIMLVEDDDSLREIYSIRLTAEGYTIVTAQDGEEALAVAVRERPDLIVSDVMMPKISGFDMLDILRSTPETQGIKVIMMTALSSEDQRARGESLGADRYLVKSQVGIEDVVNVVHDVLGDRATDGTISAAPANTAPAATPTMAAQAMAPAMPAAPVMTPDPMANAMPGTVVTAQNVQAVSQGVPMQGSNPALGAVSSAPGVAGPVPGIANQHQNVPAPQSGIVPGAPFAPTM